MGVIEGSETAQNRPHSPSAPINPPRRQGRPANDLISTNRSQSEERPPQHRAENRGGQAAVAAQCAAPWADRGDRDRRLGGQRRLPRVRGGGDRGLRRADCGRARACAAAWPRCSGGCGGSFRSRPICSGFSRKSSANVEPRLAIGPVNSGRQDPQLHLVFDPQREEESDGEYERRVSALPMSVRDLTCCFLRLGNLDNGAFERLGRYNAVLWKQTAQTLFLLHSIRRS